MNQADEAAARLADLQDGPWQNRGAHARTVLQLAAESDRATTTDLPAGLRRAMRPHWESGISDPDEMKLRDSLDFALTELQLLELAIETGYLTTGAVEEHARHLFHQLLWAPAAQQFVRTYGYVGVEFLANRVGFRPLASRTAPPEPDVRGALRFASFLDHHRLWLEDELVEEWLAFLDDYVEYEGEQDDFYEFLTASEPRGSARFNRLATGAWRSVQMLSDLFGVLHEHERSRVGLFYSYWLAKLFGYEYENGRYARNTSIWDEDDSWAKALESSPAIRQIVGHEAGHHAELMKREIRLLRDVWKITAALVSSR